MPARLRRVLTLAALSLGAGVIIAPAAAAPQPVQQAAEKATIKTFTGTWYAHGASLRVNGKGRAIIRISDGCCTHLLTLKFRLSRVAGTTAKATARARLTSARYSTSTYPPASKRKRVGYVGTLRLRGGVITDPFLKLPWCDEAAANRGVCGA